MWRVGPSPTPTPPASSPQDKTAMLQSVLQSVWAPEQFSECSCGQCVLSWRGVEAFLRELPAQNCFSLFSAGVVLMTKKGLSQLFSVGFFFSYLSTYFLQYTGPIVENCNYNPPLGDSVERGQLRNIVCWLLWAKRGRERWASEALSLEAYRG